MVVELEAKMVAEGIEAVVVMVGPKFFCHAHSAAIFGVGFFQVIVLEGLAEDTHVKSGVVSDEETVVDVFLNFSP